LQNPSQIIGDIVKNERRETSRIFRKNKRKYLKDKIKELENNNKNKNIRDLYGGINEFKNDYQHRIHIKKTRMIICSQIHRMF
jgi:mRNA-degrading endonuclease RelE of RelBE toxin-antitoxin system